MPLYDACQVIEWTKHRLGRGTKSHIVKPPEKTLPPGEKQPTTGNHAT